MALTAIECRQTDRREETKGRDVNSTIQVSDTIEKVCKEQRAASKA
jgi:hypothetical protein